MATHSGEFGIVIKWSGKEYKISGLDENETLLDLKNAIQKETGVLPHRQKLLGLKTKGKVCAAAVEVRRPAKGTRYAGTQHGDTRTPLVRYSLK